MSTSRRTSDRPTWVWLAQESTEPDIRVFGDAAVIALDVHDRGTRRGEPFEGYFRSLFVYVRREGDVALRRWSDHRPI